MNGNRVAAVMTVVAVLALAGCVAPSVEQEGGSGSGFTGPWAELFEQTYSEASSDEERAALADGEISAQEYAYFQGEIVKCLAGLNVSAHFLSDGALEYSNPDQVSQERIAACNADNGIRLLTLRDTIVRNPSNLDENKLIVECLKRTGIVDDSYTSDDLDNGVDMRDIGQTREFAGCLGDPLNFGT